MLVVGLSYAETEDRSTPVSAHHDVPRVASDDMHDTPDEMARWKPIAAALERCQELIEPLYQDADRTAMQFQKQHQLITVTAALTGTIAVLFAILQLPRILAGLAASIPLAEGVTATIAFIAVLLGIFTLRQVGWMFLRHKAERFKFLKFHFLIDPHLWSPDAGKREHVMEWLTDAAEKTSALTNEELETWAEHGILPEEPANLAGSQADVYTLYSLVDYYLTKRCRNQLKYFERKAKQFSNRDRYLKALPPLLFFGSVFAALLHFALDIVETYILPHEVAAQVAEATAQVAEATVEATETAVYAASGITLTVALILLAASLPVLGTGIRTFRSAHEMARNTSRYKAAFEAIKLPAERLESDAERLHGLYSEGHTTVDAYHVFRDMWRCEQILEAEHREWLRLMMEAEWFG